MFNQLTSPDIELSKDDLPSAISTKKNHDDLLSYLTERLDSGKQPREDRVNRYASIDKVISTWQELSATDSQRADKQENTGEAQAVRMNLPLLQTHIDDMVSYFAGIYAPTNGEFFYSADPKLLTELKQLVDKLKADARASKYYNQIARALRALLKYNEGGVKVRWVHDDFDEDAIGPLPVNRNKYEFIDMYNVLWDPSIDEPNKIASEGEWAATVSVKNKIWLLRRETRALLDGVGAVLNGDSNSLGQATYYKHPPHQVGVETDDGRHNNRTQSTNWDSYFPTLKSDAYVPINGHEVVDMYCWIVPSQFGLAAGGSEDAKSSLQLWRFLILDGRRIISAMPFDRTEMIPGTEEEEIDQAQIPLYMTRLNADDLGNSQRSVAELLRPFQSYGSFLVNAHIDSVRSEIFGVTVYDPQMFDMQNMDAGSTTARIASKMPGRDVRTGLHKLNTDASTRQPLNDLQTLMTIMREFFPSQALPNQIAGMDRAISSQVTAVMQGSLRRLIMYMRVMDADMLGPVRKQSYRNIANYASDSVQLENVKEADIDRLLGSGVEAANNEAAAGMMQQLLFAMMQNSETAQRYDVPAVMRIWAHMQNLDVDLSQVERPPQQPAQGQTPGAPAGGEAPIA